jgi:hypothetical protein
MKKILLLLVPVLFLSGCISLTSPVMLDKSFPSAEKYEILGPVDLRGKQSCFLGFAWGGIGWLNLFNEANRKYGYVDDVVSVSVDTKINGVFGTIFSRDITMRGTAIRYIRSNSTRARQTERRTPGDTP